MRARGDAVSWGNVAAGKHRVKMIPWGALLAGAMLTGQVVAAADAPSTPAPSPAEASAQRAHEALLLAVAETTQLGALRLRLADWQLLSRDYAELPADPTLTDRWRTVRARALAEGADDPLVQASVLTARDGDADAAARGHAVAVLSAATGDNGYFGLSLLALPAIRQDPAATQRLLHAMAGAPRFHSPIIAMLQAFNAAAAPLDWRVAMPADASAPMDPELFYRVESMALAAAVAYAPIQPLQSTCKQAEGALRADCDAIARRWLADGDTLADRNFATMLLLQICEDAQACATAQAARRNQAWLQTKTMAFTAPFDGSLPPDLAHYLARVAAVGEIAAMQELVAAHGLPLEPPADWRSPWDTPAQK